MTDSNPYEPPGTGPDRARWRPTLGRGQVAWLACYLLNLITPAAFGLPMLDPMGRWGMVLAVLVLGLAGLILVTVQPRLVAASVIGAAVVAGSQLMPILQILAGAVAVALTGRDSFAGSNANMPDARPIDFVGGVLVTTLTGVQLWAASLVIGLVLVALARRLGGQALPPPTAGIQNAR